ncbi:hypothetical protein Bca52824_074928 [Brassica carinata]|uniref:Uncharacterized protein n=1 Tax=Brassica carinata TaxID=52824 RepID=A0A8X7PNJ6_BRACI|nr:hypothetical protein Bca52824_074928 [Brassica carinata]
MSPIEKSPTSADRVPKPGRPPSAKLRLGPAPGPSPEPAIKKETRETSRHKEALKNAAGSKSSGSSLGDDDVCDWGFVVRKKRRVDEVYPSGGEGSSCRELARVILKLGEVYERIEGAKQRMMVELEKHRMEVAKEIELQRMNMLMDMQMELERSKLAKRRTAASATLVAKQIGERNSGSIPQTYQRVLDIVKC